MVKFIGIDLGWTSGASGLACVQWQNNCLKILDLTRLQELEAIFAWLDNWLTSTEAAIIAVDAPTIIPNATGMREADRLTHKYFGRYHAGCYPANLQSSFAKRTVDFGLSLEAKGFNHGNNVEPQQLGRWQIEVYPHPAIVNLFALERILKYKKGRLSKKKAELERLRHCITTILPFLEPNLEISPLLPIIPNTVTGKQLKAIEDMFDGLLCAYIAAYWWYWGEKKNLVLGDRYSGYIIVPTSQTLN